MFGINWIDIITIGLLGSAVYAGYKVGLVTQLFAIAGTFGTLFVAGWLFPHLLPIHDQSLRTSLGTTLVLVATVAAGIGCLLLGRRIHLSIHAGSLGKNPLYKRADRILGGLAALSAGLVLTWLMGVAISRLPFEGFSNSVSDARIMQLLTHTMPPVPAVFNLFGEHINPNNQPEVPLHPAPRADFDYSVADERSAAAYGEKASVRITSFGCGGLVTGSGFVAAPHLVATNAHVVAGVKRPIVKYQGRSYEGTPVFFDAARDIAMLRVPKLSARPLALAQQNVPLDSTVAIVGYPGGDYEDIPGIIRDTLALSVSSIYNQGSFGRGVYVVQGTVEEGSSGSPLVLKDGTVAGMVFSKSETQPEYTYAITSPHLVSARDQAQSSDRRVSTGACLAH